MKKITRRSFVAALAFCLAGCAANTSESSDSTTKDETSEPAKKDETSEPATADNTEPAADGDADAEPASSILVAYYSASGNTERVAEIVADELGADTFELLPVEPYSEADLDWMDGSSRVSAEHNDQSLRDIELESTEAPNWDAYDTILVGYPIWYGDASWVLNTFVKGNDFSGKTVIPFCTSTNAGIGRSGSNLASMAGTGDWKDGMRFVEQEDESVIRDWAKGLGL